MKLKEYRKKKKKKRNTGLVFLEYRLESESEKELAFEPELVLEVLELPQPKAPSLYDECQ